MARAQALLLAGLGIVALGLAGCGGENPSSSSTTTPPPVLPPGPGSGAPVPVTSAKNIVSSITKVTVPDDGKPEIEVYLRDENNFSLTGLQSSAISFVLARLEPPFNGKSSTWHAITRRTEAFPGDPPPVPANYVTGTGPTSQATTEKATSGVWTDHNNGVYTYKFAKSLKDDPAIPFDGTCRTASGWRSGSPRFPRTTRSIRSTPSPTHRSMTRAGKSSTTTPATSVTTASLFTVARAPTCSTARCATSRTRPTRKPATPWTSRS